jgi:uncharacterized damage-inducible protein DinB
MTPDQAKLMLGFFVSVLEQETPTTIKVLRAIPEDRCDYRPAKQSRSAIELARHLPVVELWFYEGVIQGKLPLPDPGAESSIKTVAQAISVYENQVRGALERVKQLSGEELARPMSMLGLFTKPAVWFLSLLIRHSVHHRGQLSAYLRPMGALVPAIYVDSADQPFDPTADTRPASVV